MIMFYNFFLNDNVQNDKKYKSYTNLKNLKIELNMYIRYSNLVVCLFWQLDVCLKFCKDINNYLNKYKGVILFV